METTLKIKSSWEEITLDDFLTLKEIEERGISDLEKDILKLAFLADVDDSYFNPFPASEIKKLSSALTFLDTEPTAEIKDYYQIGDTKYKFISNISDLTAGQFIDIISYTKKKEEIIEKLNWIASIFLLPVRKNSLLEKIRTGKKERIEKYLETPQGITAGNIYDNMKITELMGMSVFFCNLLNAFVETTLPYLEMKTKTQLKQVLKKLNQDTTLKENPKIMKMITKLQKQATSLNIMDGLQQ